MVTFVGPTELYIKSICGTTAGKRALIEFAKSNYGFLRMHLPPNYIDSRILLELGFRVERINAEPPAEANLAKAYWTACEMYVLM